MTNGELEIEHGVREIRKLYTVRPGHAVIVDTVL